MTAIASLRETISLWIAVNRSRNTLAKMDDRMLADIGVTREQAATEAKRWFWDHKPRGVHDEDGGAAADDGASAALADAMRRMRRDRRNRARQTQRVGVSVVNKRAA